MRALRFARTSLPKPGRRKTPLFLASFDASESVSSRIPSICFRVRLVFSARYATVADFVIVFATGDLLSLGGGGGCTRTALLPQAAARGYPRVTRTSPAAISRRYAPKRASASSILSRGDSGASPSL